jgi:hypothetical protein
MKQVIAFFIFFVSTHIATSQELLENNPPSVKWSQVNTRHFRVIFPRGFDAQGIRVANNLEGIHDPEAFSLGSYPRKISVILQNQSAESNGFVSILPRRSEFYAMPSQNYNFTGTNDWLDLLVSHEYRHVVQYQHAIRGFNRFLYYVFGGATLAGMSQVAAPDWFWEGDAVVTETAFTPGGRGKIPAFSRLFRTNLMEGRTFNYHKQYLRSYKNNIPDHYVFGYHMVSYLRKRTDDPLIWGNITARAWRAPFVPFIFSSSIKKKSGLSVTKLYREMAKDYKKVWQEELSKINVTPFQVLPVKRHRAYTDFLYPQAIADGRVLVMRKGIGNIEQFVVLNGRREEKVFTPGFINDSGMISASGSVVVWNEFGYDPRWSVRNYSRIKAYDFNKKKKYVVGGRRARYSSAAISPNQDKIVAVWTGTDYKTEVVVLSFPAGKVLLTFPNPDNHFYSMPRWSRDGSKIVSLKTVNGKRSVVVLNPETQAEKELIKPTDENIGYPVLYYNMLLFNSPATGIDNIGAIDLSSGVRYQVTSSKYGALNPCVSPDGKKIYYNEQGKDGLDVAMVPFNVSSWRVVEQPVVINESSYLELIKQEGHPDLLIEVPQPKLPVAKYSKVNGLFNPYTWGIFVDSDLKQANIGISSQDILSTTKFEAGYVFDISEQTSAWRAALSYQALFPVLDVEATYGSRKVSENVGDETITFEWIEKTVEGGVRIPLVTTSSRFIGNVAFGNSVGFINVTDFKNNVDEGGRIFGNYFFREYADNGNLLFNHANFGAYRYLKRSRRDINSKWAQRVGIEHYSTPYGGNFQGELLGATAYLFFPGLLRHHSIWGYGAYQSTQINRNTDNYLFQNQVPIPRGQSVGRYQKFYSMSANYTFPLWYPDIAFGPLLNIQRIRANGFFDSAIGQNELVDVSDLYQTVGVEVKVDFNILRFLPQIDIGVRYSKGLNPSTSEFEVLIGTINF